MGADFSAPWAARAGTRAPRGSLPDFTSFFTFHSSFSLTASSALPMVRRQDRRRCPAAPEAPRAPSPPRCLPDQRPTRKAEPPAAALPACSRRRNHCPVLGSAAIFRAPHRRQAAGPAPSHSWVRGGVRSATGGSGRGGGCACLGAAGRGARHADRCHGSTHAPDPRARTGVVRTRCLSSTGGA